MVFLDKLRTLAGRTLPMAPTIASRFQILQTQPHESKEAGSGRRRLSLDSWACLPVPRPVLTTSSTASQISSTATSSCTTQKDVPHSISATSDMSFIGEDEAVMRESGCETPKSGEHRIPDVDVTFCPPAPRKPRAMSRRRRVQPTSFFTTPDFETFLSHRKVQVIS